MSYLREEEGNRKEVKFSQLRERQNKRNKWDDLTYLIAFLEDLKCTVERLLVSAREEQAAKTIGIPSSTPMYELIETLDSFVNNGILFIDEVPSDLMQNNPHLLNFLGTHWRKFLSRFHILASKQLEIESLTSIPTEQAITAIGALLDRIERISLQEFTTTLKDFIKFY